MEACMTVVLPVVGACAGGTAAALVTPLTADSRPTTVDVLPRVEVTVCSVLDGGGSLAAASGGGGGGGARSPIRQLNR